MAKDDDNIYDFYWKNIRKKLPGDLVPVENLSVGVLGSPQLRALQDIYENVPEKVKVLIPSKSLKHIHEKRPAWSFDIIVCKTRPLLLYADSIHENKNEQLDKSFVTFKMMDGKYFLTVFEPDFENGSISLKTCYEVEEKEIKKYNLLWEYSKP